jgi:hypothetical protein
MYANPAYNIALTFMKVFPIGLVVTTVSAGILRKKSNHRKVHWLSCSAWLCFVCIVLQRP